MGSSPGVDGGMMEGHRRDALVFDASLHVPLTSLRYATLASLAARALVGVAMMEAAHGLLGRPTGNRDFVVELIACVGERLIERDAVLGRRYPHTLDCRYRLTELGTAVLIAETARLQFIVMKTMHALDGGGLGDG